MAINPETIEGWLFPEEGALLEKYAKEVSQFTDIIELGCYKGKSTVYLARSTDAMVISVDTFMSDNTTVDKKDTLTEFLENTKEYPNVLPMPSLTRHVAQIMSHNQHAPRVSLLFIDADHSYEGVSFDFTSYQPFLAPGAVVIFHDAYGENGEEQNTPWKGVTQFCKELEGNTNYKLIEKCRRCAVFRRTV